ncbi:hypothetical protein INH39_24330 [Massilia violaceinigra]|uniref:Uncharacterized protein n=1 Tax=Massilia violaceinigra TaxID=2045208 RepID=A0ABY4A1B0_9BURK|nr:hypothetical protein [Massilia violaceinigra]UOD28550.1 hypothetical protein INH39_24330 [Massilia violaceinigra]
MTMNRCVVQPAFVGHYRGDVGDLGFIGLGGRKSPVQQILSNREGMAIRLAAASSVRPWASSSLTASAQNPGTYVTGFMFSLSLTGLSSRSFRKRPVISGIVTTSRSGAPSTLMPMRIIHAFRRGHSFPIHRPACRVFRLEMKSWK